MQKQIPLNEQTFQEMERNILSQVTEISKSIIETFKFKMLYDSKISRKQNEKTMKELKEFRAKNWDGKLSRNEAYKKYLNLY
ncbi:MAG: hypothetical protein Q8R04_05750 [Nanoarchaeota archaeon]|nr:hypothetical protein [Nanoarchaeota archaeon]